MNKIIVAFKSHDIFGDWDYIEYEYHSLSAIEYAILCYRGYYGKLEHFKNAIFCIKDETKRKQTQNIEDLQADAIIFADEFDGTVKLRYQNQVMDLIDFRTELEIEQERFDDLIKKYRHDFYIRSSEELEEFKQAAGLFDKSGNFDEVEIVDYVKGYANTTNFPILALVNWHQFRNEWGGEENHLRFTLVDSSLGL